MIVGDMTESLEECLLHQLNLQTYRQHKDGGNRDQRKMDLVKGITKCYLNDGIGESPRSVNDVSLETSLGGKLEWKYGAFALKMENGDWLFGTGEAAKKATAEGMNVYPIYGTAMSSEEPMAKPRRARRGL